MKMRLLGAVLLLSLSAMGSEKVLQLSDGRILRGELLGEQDGMVVLSMKVDEVTAQVRVDKKDILSMKEPSAVKVAPSVVLQAPTRAPAADDPAFARARQLLAQARQERSEATGPLANPLLGGYYGYPYPTWQHWPWIFALGGTSTWYGGHHGRGGHGGHGGRSR